MFDPFKGLRQFPSPSLRPVVQAAQHAAQQANQTREALGSRIGAVTASVPTRADVRTVTPNLTPSFINRSQLSHGAPQAGSPQAAYVNSITQGFVNLRRQNGQ